MNIIKELESLQIHREDARGEKRVGKQHEAGKLTAWERINLLVDKGTFVETEMLLEHRCVYFGMESKHVEGDGVITGYGKIEGRTVCVYAQDFTVFGGSISEMNARKISNIQKKALDMQVPIIGLIDSGGARVQEGIQSLSGHGHIFYNNVKSSGKIPQISAIMGTCAGGASYSPALTDFIIMVEHTSCMFITGPAVVKQAIGEETTKEELGGAKIHSEISGMADCVAEDDKQCIQLIKHLLQYLPDNCNRVPKVQNKFRFSANKTENIELIIPDSKRRAFDVRKLIECIIDDESGFAIKDKFATNMVTMFATIGGHPIGIVANQSFQKAGCIDIDAADKASNFIRICDSFHIPLLNLVDVSGFYPGKEQEQRGIIRHGAKMLFAYSEADVLKITVIIRKGYGGAYLAMCSKELGADMVYAWPDAEMAVMGAEAAIEVLYKKATAAEKEKHLEKYKEQFLNPYEAAHMGYVDEVIEPKRTREFILRVLENESNDNVFNGYGHGNIPL